MPDVSNTTTRKITKISTAHNAASGGLVTTVLCTDGTLWFLDSKIFTKWQLLPTIPQFVVEGAEIMADPQPTVNAGMRDISALPPDSMLRELIRAAQREWDMQAEMPSDEIERLRKVVFHGSEIGFDAYMKGRLLHHLSNILIVAVRTDFMKGV